MALFFTVLLGLAVSVLGYFNYYFHKGHYISGAENLINAEVNHIMDIWPLIGGEEVLSSLIEASKNRGDKIYALQDLDGHILIGNIRQIPKTVHSLTEGIITFTLTPVAVMGTNIKPGSYAAKVKTFPDNTALLVGLRMDEITAQYQFMQLLSVITIIIMVIVIVTSFAISTFVVNRTNRIADTARNIMDTGDLSRRISIDSNWDDLSFIGNALNHFLDRIEGLVRDVRQVSDNIAHDLRTPLTRLRNKLEKLSQDERVTQDPKLAGYALGLIDDADHLLGTFSALLRIANIESGKQTSHFDHIDLDVLLHDVIELYEAFAEDRAIRLVYSGTTAPFCCDRNLLFQAFANIADNALKFTPSGGTVTCRLEKTDSLITVTFFDTGQGVPDAEKDKIFNRFYRGDKSRHSPGSGLGLSLVAAIISLHRGHISVHDNHPGLRVEVRLPISPLTASKHAAQQASQQAAQPTHRPD